MQVFHFGVFESPAATPVPLNRRAASGAILLGGGARSYRTAIFPILRRTIVTCGDANPRAKSISGGALEPL